MTKLTVSTVIDRLLWDVHSSEIVEFVETLPEDNGAIVGYFCERYGHLSNDPDYLFGLLCSSSDHLVDVLIDIAHKRKNEEEKYAQEEMEVMRDLRIANEI